MSVEQERPWGRVTAGIDWVSEDHWVAIVDDRGRAVERFAVAHTAPDLRRLVQRLHRAGVVEVAIERPDGPVVDALLDAQLMVFVIAPKQIKNQRGRYGSAGNKDDRFDAFVLGDVLRTDRARLHPLQRDSDATLTLRMTVRARKDLINARIAMAKQLCAHLQITLPAALARTLTWDQGHEMAAHARFSNETGIAVYFCDPKSPWQRGSNGNTVSIGSGSLGPLRRAGAGSSR